MATLGNEFSTVSSKSNSTTFSPYDLKGNNNIYSNGVMEQQRQMALKQAQMLFLQHQQMMVQANVSDPANVSPSATSPTPTRSSPSDSVSPTFDQTTPEKLILSQSPPSPADSGVVADSKSEAGNVSHDLLHNIEQNKLDDSLGFLASQRNTVTSLSFEAITTSADHSLLKQDDLSFASNNNSLGLSTSSSNKESGLGVPSSEDSGSVMISQNLAAIWSTPSPTTSSNDYQFPQTTMDDMMLQALQQQQQFSWPNQPNSLNAGSITNPPPGLYNNTTLQKQLQQQNTAAQIHAIQQQLALRRSQSMVPQPASLNRSTSHQPGMAGGFGNMNQTRMNNFLPSSKLPANYSSWSNGQQALGNGWSSQPNRNASLFNSLQQNTSSMGRVMNGSTDYRKQSLGSQMPHAPKLNRSISTPATRSYLNGMDENPFYKMSDPHAQNGLMSLHENGANDLMSMAGLESQLCDILRSSEPHNVMPRNCGKWMDMNNDTLYEDVNQIAPNLNSHLSPLLGEFARDRYSRKVFVGGLPPDIDEDEIKVSFQCFGSLVVDWPHKAESKSYFPPKGYAFLLFQDELSVQNLISHCMKDGDKLYLRVSSPTIRDKPVQIRPWNLSDSDFVLDGSQPLDPRKTIFVGGVPRPLRAVELAMIMDRLYGGVCYAGIDVDPELKYPKGAGRVAFSNQQSYIAAISARFVQLQHGDIDKRVEVKPYVLDDQHCDECQGMRCGGKFAPFFCANVTCLQYYCESCWATVHTRPGKEFHKPLVKEGADRASRSMTFRW